MVPWWFLVWAKTNNGFLFALFCWYIETEDHVTRWIGCISPCVHVHSRCCALLSQFVRSYPRVFLIRKINVLCCSNACWYFVSTTCEATTTIQRRQCEISVQSHFHNVENWYQRNHNDRVVIPGLRCMRINAQQKPRDSAAAKLSQLAISEHSKTIYLHFCNNAVGEDRGARGPGD